MKQYLNRFLFTILISLFFLPFIFAWLCYSGKISLGKKHTNHGTLIVPPFSINAFYSNTTNNPFKGKWLMLLVYPGNCTDSCQHSLYNLRQLRLATGSDMNRIERAILTYNNQTNHTLSQLLALPFQGTKEIRVNRLEFESIIKKEIPASATAILPGTIYLVDPHGNIMMFYAPPADPKGMFKDLQRLLKVSQIG